MIVHVYVRHSKQCAHRKNAGWKQCKCPKHLLWHHEGKLFRRSAKTRSWSKAELEARAVELRLQTAELGRSPAPREAVTIAKAVELFLADKKSQQLRKATLDKLQTIFRKQLLSWCRQNGVHFLLDLDLGKLQEFRSSWRDGALAARKKQERLRGFFHFVVGNGWIQHNPAKGLSRIKVEQKPTDYFPPHEYARIIDSTYIYDRHAVEKQDHNGNAARLRALAQLMRWSGLSIRDAVTLDRSRLGKDDNLFLYRAKTGVPVYLPLPGDVAEELRNIPPGPKPNPRYFFWSGNGDPKSAVADWQRAFRKLFKLAAIRYADNQPKRCFPHMFRDTFAVECLLAGVPLEDVSKYLGHSSIKTTEKHYAPFVKARQEQMVDTMKRAWNVMAASRAPQPAPRRARRKTPRRNRPQGLLVHPALQHSH